MREYGVSARFVTNLRKEGSNLIEIVERDACNLKAKSIRQLKFREGLFLSSAGSSLVPF